MKKQKIALGLISAALLSMLSCDKPTDNPNQHKIDSITTQKNDSTNRLLEIIELKSGNLSFKFDPNTGARITSISVDSMEALIQKEEFEIYGSTFWTAPQSAWGWPPIKEIDEMPYKKTPDNSYKSSNADTIGVCIIKKFTSNQDSSFSVTYTIQNNSDHVVKMAPWEISRVASGGTTIFPSENAVFKGKKPFGELKINTKNGISTMKYDSAAINDNKKTFAYSSKGWLAQHKGKLLLIKKFENILPSECAPDESEIEIYANPNKKYIEIEQTGAYKSISSMESYSWEVKWYLRNVEDKNYTELEYQKLVESIIK